MDAHRRLSLPDGMRVSYADAGAADGEPVLFLHGTPGSRMQVTGDLNPVAARLGLRLVAPDRPGCGDSSFVRYEVADYPGLLERFVDALAIDRFALVGTSGGGRYACACASVMTDRVRRVVLVASTAPSDLPGVRAAWTMQDRRTYRLAVRAPWLLRAYLARLARHVGRDPEVVRRLFPALAAADERLLARPDARAVVAAMFGEAFRQGARGVTHDFRLEALPWSCDLGAIRAPIDVWHGLADTLVAPEQGVILADALPGPERHFVAGEGHLSLIGGRAADYLRPLAE